MATSLGRLQAALHDHLLGRTSGIEAEVLAGGLIDTPRRLRIYHHAYRARLLEALRDAYEKTWSYLGDERFDACAGAYIESHPPIARSLRWYGADWPAWLDAQYPADGDIGELAALDWQLRRAFDGPDAAPLPLSSLQQLTPADWESVGFELAPTLQLLPLRFNSLALWHAIDREQMPPPAQPLSRPAQMAVWRKGWQPHFRSLDDIEHAALDALQRGSSFAATCLGLERDFPGHDIAAASAGHLRQWFDDELVVAVTGPDHACA